MLEYIIGSGIACIVLSKVTVGVVQSRMDSLGYVSVSEVKEKKKKTAKDYVLGFLSNFIPVINNLAGLVLIGVSGYMVFASDENVSSLFDKVPSIKKASEAKDIYDRRRKSNNFDAMEDAMKLDGADSSTINREMSIAKSSCGIPDDKAMKKISAMSDAELWLLDIEMNVGLTDEEKKALYKDYVKDFSKAKSNGAVIEKTLKMTSKINR